ncbi:hypothetical protein [Enterobacter hormaechei]
MERRNEAANAHLPPAADLYRSDLLLWRITLYVAMSGVGWQLYDRLPPHRLAIRRIALIFIVLIVLNEIGPEVFR